jgi:hypothetical protein
VTRPGSQSITVPTGSRVTVELHRARRRRRAGASGGELPDHARAVYRRYPARAGVYDLGTVYQFDHYPGLAAVSKYNQIGLESDVLFRSTARARVREALLSNLTETTVADSGRRILSPYRFQVSGETDTAATALFYHQSGRTERVALSGESESWAARIPAATQEATLTARLDSRPADAPERQTLIEARAAVRRERYEQWDAVSRPRRGREATAAAYLTDGLWEQGFDSYRIYQPFTSWDRVNFKITAEPSFAAADVEPIKVEVGPYGSSWTDVLVAPQMHQWTLQYYARYAVGTLFFTALVAWPTTGTFLERLPFYPFPYDEAGALVLGRNERALSFMAARSRPYAQMLAFDRAVEVYSPYFFVILIDRVGGRIALNWRNIAAGTLAAVIRTRAGDAVAGTRYVWRRTELVRPNTQFDFQGLFTREVAPFHLLDVDGGPLPNPYDG